MGGTTGFSCANRLGWFDVSRLGAFLALGESIFYRLPFLQRPEALSSNLRVMNKYILAAVIRNDKTKTLFLVEPFYFTCSHVFLLLTLYTAGSPLLT